MSNKKPANKQTKAPVAVKVEATGSIQDQAIKLMFEKTGKLDDRSRPLGHSYAVILDKIIAANPRANTTSKCLSWYASKLKSGKIKCPDGLSFNDMPQRPRVLAKK